MNDKVDEFLKPILKDCEGKHYLFRGVTKSYEGKKETEGAKKINSSLYRWAKDKDIPFHEKYGPFNIEEEILERAKRHFADNTSNIEILTDLQHLQQDHGKTNLIDFSRNLYIALFFACDGKHQGKDGELIFLDSTKIEEKSAVVYKDLKLSSDPFLIEPAKTQISQRRVTFQSSVFVYPPSGYINKDLCKIISVPVDLKKSILEHLRKIHNIHTDTIYNDLIGFIANEKNYETASVLFHQGLALDNKGEYKEAIEKYDGSIEANSNHAETYCNRGNAKYYLGQYQDAMVDYDKAIELRSNYAEAYGNRGVAKNNLRQHLEAISDFNRAIELNPNYAIAYNNRGIAKDDLGQYQEAISDFDKAIELDPNDADAYNNRGFTKNNLGQHQEAIADYDKAIELKPNNAIAYNNRGVSKRKLELLREAIADYDKAIELDPNYAGAYLNRGIANQALGRTQEADEDFKMAAKLKSDEAS